MNFTVLNLMSNIIISLERKSGYSFDILKSVYGTFPYTPSLFFTPSEDEFMELIKRHKDCFILSKFNERAAILFVLFWKLCRNVGARFWKMESNKYESVIKYSCFSG